MSKRLFLFIASVYLAGAASAIYALSKPPSVPVVHIVVFVLLAYLADFLSVDLPREGTVDPSLAIYFGAMLAFGPSVPVLGALLGMLQVADIMKRKPWYRMVFNAAQTATFIVAMYLTFVALGGKTLAESGGQLAPLSIIAALAAIPVAALVNLGLVGCAIALSSRTPLGVVWRENYRWLIVNYATLGVMGILLAATYSVARVPAVALLVVPLVIARQTFSVYLERRDACLKTVHSLVAAIEAKDPYTRGHSERVAEYAVRTAEELGLSREVIESVRFAALLHDLGKIAVERRILNKPSRLTEEEYAAVKEHPEMGAQILQRITFLRDSIPAIRLHHERPDGRGYGLARGAEWIPEPASILAVADGFDAMTSARPYRRALTVEEAVAELLANSGTQFEPRVLGAFLRAMSLQGVADQRASEADAQLSLNEAIT